LKEIGNRGSERETGHRILIIILATSSDGVLKTARPRYQQLNLLLIIDNDTLSQKKWCLILAIALPNTRNNQFSKFFHYYKEEEISNKMHTFSTHFKCVATLPCEMQTCENDTKLLLKFNTFFETVYVKIR